MRSFDIRQRPNRKANADRLAALWNAANDMTNKQAVAYLEHGAEMVEELRRSLLNCPNTVHPGVCPKKCGCKTVNLLAKLEG